MGNTLEKTLRNSPENKRENILWIARTAVFIALLVTLQFTTNLTGITYLTGSVVNMMLILSVMTCGIYSGITVAAISPVVAWLIGVVPLPVLIPFIIVGNITIVSVWHFIGNRGFGKKYVPYALALVCGAAAKYLVLYISIVQVAVPFLLGADEKMAKVVSNLFAVHQIITALTGGVLAFIILPRLKKFILREQG